MRFKIITTIILLVVSVNSTVKAQSRTILIFDLQTNSIDSVIIDISSIDTSKQSDFSSFFIGDFSTTIEVLEQETPTENLVEPNAKSTKRRKVHLDYDLNNFPIRTSVKTSYIENDTMKNLCSGSIISKKHVLTAAHCHLIKDMDSLLVDSLIVCPAYDNGEQNLNFECSNITRIFSFKDWTLEEDFVILETEHDIGTLTGWIGIGFDNDRSSIENEHLFYKFDYAARYIPHIDSTHYNGDTMYYRYGRAKVFTFNFEDSTFYKVGLQGNHGINGESGGSLVSIINESIYASFGIHSNGPHSFHSMISNEVFYVINQLIKDDVITNVNESLKETEVTIFPNPTSGIVQFDKIPTTKNNYLIITDALGKKVFSRKNVYVKEQIDLSHLPNGHYFVSFTIDGYTSIRRIVILGG